VKKIKIAVNGREVDAFLVDKIYRIRKRKEIDGKIYEWDEYYIHVYVPGELRDKKFLIIPL